MPDVIVRAEQQAPRLTCGGMIFSVTPLDEMKMNFHLLVVAGITVIGVLLLRLFRRDPPRPTSVEPWVIEAFRKKKRKQWLLGIPVGLVFIFIYWHRAYPSGAELVLMPVAFVVVAGVCIFSYRNWRCPKCGAYLGKYAWQAGVCPKCGTALREPRESQGDDGN